MEEKEFEIKNVDELIKQLKESLKAKEDEDDFIPEFEVRSTQEGVLLSGNIKFILFGFGAISKAIAETLEEDGIPKTMVKKILVSSIISADSIGDMFKKKKEKREEADE